MVFLYLDLPKDAKWFLKGVKSPVLRVGVCLKSCIDFIQLTVVIRMYGECCAALTNLQVSRDRTTPVFYCSN